MRQEPLHDGGVIGSYAELEAIRVKSQSMRPREPGDVSSLFSDAQVWIISECFHHLWLQRASHSGHRRSRTGVGIPTSAYRMLLTLHILAYLPYRPSQTCSLSGGRKKRPKLSKKRNIRAGPLSQPCALCELLQ